MTGSVSFDRAADCYDETRRLPPGAADMLTGLLAAELAGHEPALEIGVGTGRIALPLHAHRVQLIGLDLSERMLARLVANAGGRRPFALLRADATRLPIADQRVGAVLASHLLHLVADWPAAVAEACRVVDPSGPVLIDLGGGDPDDAGRNDWAELVGRVARQVGLDRSRPVRAPGALDRELARHGRAPRRLPLVPVHQVRRMADVLDEMEHQVHSWTWKASPADMRAAVSHAREWATARFGDLEAPRPFDSTLQWTAYERLR